MSEFALDRRRLRKDVVEQEDRAVLAVAQQMAVAPGQDHEVTRLEPDALSVAVYLKPRGAGCQEMKGWAGASADAKAPGRAHVR